MESKVYESFSNFFNFPDTALKFGAYYFQSNLANVAITQFYVQDNEIFFKIRENQRFERSSRKGKLLLKTAGFRNIFIFSRPLIYESFLL